MLRKNEVQRLRTHLLGIFQNVILPEVTSDGCILTQSPDGKVQSDRVTTHHLVALCIETDRDLMAGIIDSACEWFSTEYTEPQDPFSISTLAAADKLSRKDANRLTKEVILRHQRAGGFIDVYAGFLDGGSIFSTLWAIRNLQLLGVDAKGQRSIAKAFKAIEEAWDDIHRASFKGFYCELKWAAGDKHGARGRTASVVREICAAQDGDGLWDESPLYTAYVLGNLCVAPGSPTRAVSAAITRGFRALFNLDSEANTLPATFQAVAKTHVESVYLQFCIRALIGAVRYLRKFEDDDLSPDLARYVMGAFPRVYHAARQLGSQLKRMNSQYGDIQEHFSHLDRTAAAILADSPFEKNVFIMMPFRQGSDERYEKIEEIIKRELRKKGYRGWLASDKKVAPQLWDNIASYLVACKHAVAVFTRLERDRRILNEFNPNVSLELGFCLSRGRQVLILKDSELTSLQTDLVGHLYEEFDLNQVGRQLPRKIRRWLSEIDDASSSADGSDGKGNGRSGAATN